MDDNTKFYRCKQKDSDLYARLQDITKRFVALESLNELNHSMDTNANESLNRENPMMDGQTSCAGLVFSQSHNYNDLNT
jgi:hypothetical protein